MAKFLRVVFNLLLMIYIVAALALFVPPLVGVTTAVTLEGTEGNQELGSVNYAWRTPLKEVVPGDEIVVAQKNESVHVYTVKSVDPEQSVVTTAGEQETELNVRSYVHKLIFTVPYLGYLAIALQTTEGMILLAAIAGGLLLLCILTGIWCKKRKIKRMKEDEENLLDEEDNEFFQSLASQKREADARAEADYRARKESEAEVKADYTKPALDEEYEELPPAAIATSANSASQKINQEPLDDSDLLEDIEATEEPAGSSDALVPVSGGDVESADREKSESGEMEVERAVSTGNIPGVQAALEAALDTQQIQRHVRRAEVVREPEIEVESLPAEEIELAMPVYTVDEYLQKAYSAGVDPVVRKDEMTGVTYVDYSECI